MTRRRRLRMVLAWLAASGGLAAACHHDPAPAMPTITIARRGCLKKAPPVPAPWHWVHPCPKGLLCLDQPNALAVTRYKRELEDWAEQAYLSCGPRPASPPADAGTTDGGVR